ncbi:PREDICTED: uncharacterized protein LOC105950694 isoform X2 [Erythranthe guttata]|uniref:uncharacterized protein LOC105950694 isoform X2 n=1 Tax=Erythranthe guttata TaxID=4155 RepID=UPI00064DD531|nr:PREDICTED: uncharacterized protein LOC105950694 isoform X2 [Erythranthe guttata]|eukprot:XP_012829517.1 PREDICTED: uncharacterized protein LOC105950694 isoform X2 [Erythranthe guttata]
MDFKSMKRKELQGLCKKHGIPANLSNLEIVDKLTEFFKQNENPSIQGKIEGEGEICSETESTSVDVNRKVKKVRFSPDHELIEFTKSRSPKRRSKRFSKSSGDVSLHVGNVDKLKDGIVGVTGRTTRSRGSKLMEDKVNEKKEIDDVSATDRVTRLRGKSVGEGVENTSKRGTKRAKDEDVREKKSSDSADEKNLIEDIVGNPGRVTRSRRQKLMEASMKTDNEVTEVAKNINEVALVRAEIDENRVVTRNSLRKRGVVGEGKLASGAGQSLKRNGKGLEEVPKSDEIERSDVVDEPRIFLRRSKRNGNGNGDSAVINGDSKQNEKVGSKGLKDISRSEVDVDGRLVVQVEEPTKLEPRKSNRRKNATESNENQGNGELKAKNKRKYPLRGSVKELVVADEVSKDGKKVRKPTVATKWTSRSNFLVSTNENIDTDAAVENFETGKRLSKPCRLKRRGSAVLRNTRRSGRIASNDRRVVVLEESEEDSFSHHKIEARKRKSGPTSGSDVKKTKENQSEIAAAPAAAIGEVSGQSRPSSRLKEPYMDDTSYQGVLDTEELLHVDAQLSEGAESTSNEKSSKNVTSDVGPTSSRERQDLSIEDTAARADMDLIDGNEFENLGENAASRIGDETGALNVAETEVEGIPVQENLEIIETRQANVISLPIAIDHNDVDHLEASKIIFDNNKNDTSPKSGEVGILESCEGRVDSTESKSALQLKEPSSGKLRRVEGDSIAEGDETFLPNGIELKLAETEIKKPVVASDKQGVCNDSLAVASIAVCENSIENNPDRGLEVDYSSEKDEARSDKSMPDQDGSSEVYKSKCGDEDGKLDESDMFVAVRTAQDGENAVEVSDEQGIFHDSLLVEPAIASYCAKIRDEADKIDEGHEAYVLEDIQSELPEIEEGGSCDEVKGGSSVQDTSPSKPDSVFDTQGSGPTISNICDVHRETGPTADTIQEKEVDGAQSHIPGDEPVEKTVNDGENDNRADDVTANFTYEQEKPRSPLALPTATENIIQGEEISVCASEMETNGKEENNLVVAGSDSDKDDNDKEDCKDACIAEAEISTDRSISEIGNESTPELKLEDTDANCVEDREDLADARVADVEISVNCTIGKIGVESLTELKFQDTVEAENQCKNQSWDNDVDSNHSWTELEFNNLFGATVDSVTPTGPNDTSYQETEVQNPMVSMNKSITEKEKEMEGETGIESDWGDQLKLLFATPIKSLEPLNASTAVISEASAEQLNDDICASLGETNFTPETNKKEQIEKTVISSSGSMKNSDELEGSRDMLIDTDLPEDIRLESGVYLEGETAQRGDGTFELSDVDFENSHIRTACNEDVNISTETSMPTYGSPLNEEVAKTGRFEDQKDEAEKGTSLSHLPKFSDDDDVTCNETGTNNQNVDSIVPTAEKRSSFCGAESDAFTNSAMRLLFGDNENVDVEKFDSEVDHENNNKELRLEGEAVESNNIHTVQDIPATESSVSAELDDSCGTTFLIDVLPHIVEKTTCENAALSKSEDENNNSSVKSLETATEKPALGSSTCVDLLVEGSTGDRALDATEKKNARTILIHGTPAKVSKMADMKENAPMHKTSNVVGDFTTARPAKRKALEDVQWK